MSNVLLRQEAKLDQQLAQLRDAGKALCAIRDQRLYEEQYFSFDDYCKQNGLTQEFVETCIGLYAGAQP